MIKKWLDSRMKERTWDGAALIVLGLMVLFLSNGQSKLQD